MDIILVLGLVLLATAVVLLGRSMLGDTPASTERLDQISAYGYTDEVYAEGAPREPFGERVGAFVSGIGQRVGSRFSWISEEEVRKRLIAAGMYTVQPSKVFGYQVVIAVGGGLLWVWMAGLAGASLLTIVLGAVVIAAAGLLLPIAFIDHRIRQRHDLIERGLPDLIDLIVVTLEAGLSFPQSMKMAAARVHGPLSQEMRITLQEQNMGLTMSEALTNLQTRADTPGIRLFTRSVIQGEILGISIGQIMRNLAVEMRKRRKAYAEERAQKAPVKMLFPMIFLIFPAIFIVLLVPVVITIIDAFSTQ